MKHSFALGHVGYLPFPALSHTARSRSGKLEPAARRTSIPAMIYDLEHRQVALLVIDVQGEFLDEDGRAYAEQARDSVAT